MITGKEQSRVEELTRAIRELEGRLREQGQEFALEVDLRRKSEEDLRAVLDASPLGILVHQAGRFVLANPSAVSILRAAGPEEILGLTVWDFLLPEDVPMVKSRYSELHDGSGAVAPAEYRLVRLDKTVIEAEMVSRAFQRDGALRVITVMRDISDRKRMQRELEAEKERREQEELRSRKLESLALLAGGIAHDFNNLLTGILGNLALAGMLAGEKGRAERLAQAEKAAERAQALANQLLTFSRGGAPLRKVVSLRRIVQEAALFCTHGSPVACRFDLPSGLWPVVADEDQAGQVVQNLVLNSVEAMPGGGTVAVGAENRVARDGEGSPAGRYVVLWVTDQGAGISPEDLPRVFDPWFTTKPGGSGLGLAICHSIVIRHGGRMEVRSEKGQGATFEGWFPAAPEGAIPAAPPAAAASPAFAAKRVLVVDDEEMIRDLVMEMLEVLGCRSAAAPDGISGLALFREARREGDPFDLVIHDLTIPGGMGGREAIGQFLQEDPGIRAIVFSGYSNDPVMADPERYGFAGVLRKPFRFEELRDLVCSA